MSQLSVIKFMDFFPTVKQAIFLVKLRTLKSVFIISSKVFFVSLNLSSHYHLLIVSSHVTTTSIGLLRVQMSY